MNVVISKAILQDLDGIFTIEKNTFTTFWSYESLYEDICKTPIAYYLAARIDNKEVVGYIGMWHVLDEAHITNLAVDSQYRQMGIGSALLSALIEYSVQVDIKRMTLEVRDHNVNAIKLYEKFGFISYGRRKGYYQDSGEDAVIMWKEL